MGLILTLCILFCLTELSHRSVSAFSLPVVKDYEPDSGSVSTSAKTEPKNSHAFVNPVSTKSSATNGGSDLKFPTAAVNPEESSDSLAPKGHENDEFDASDHSEELSAGFLISENNGDEDRSEEGARGVTTKTDVLDLVDAKDDTTNSGGSQDVENKDTDVLRISNSEDNDGQAEVDGRIGLNVNRAHANAFGPGGFGASNAQSWTYQAGIEHANRQYQPLVNKAGGFSNTYNSGPGAPLTYANTASQQRPGQNNGYANSGFRGGLGNAYAQSNAFQQRIPIGNGATLLSNLEIPKSSQVNEDD